MNIQFAFTAIAILCMAGFAAADPQKPESKGGGEQKHAITPADVDRRLAELENSVAAMLKEVRALRDQTKSLGAASPKADEVRIFSLKHADASSMARMLKQLLQGPDAKNLSIAVDDRTNSVVVRGGGEHLEVIEAIISRLEEKSAKAGKTEEKPRAKDTDKAKAVLSDLDEFKSRFKNLDIDVEKLQERADYLKRMGQKGFLSATEIEPDMKKLESARDEILKARDQLLKEFQKSMKPESIKSQTKYEYEAEKKPKE